MHTPAQSSHAPTLGVRAAELTTRGGLVGLGLLAVVRGCPFIAFAFTLAYFGLTRCFVRPQQLEMRGSQRRPGPKRRSIS